MYGVTSNLDLSAFPGREVTGIQSGAYQLQVQLHPAGCLSWMGQYELETNSEGTIEAGTPADAIANSRLAQLVGTRIISAKPDPPDRIHFEFSGGYKLWLLDSSDAYESLELWPGPIVV